MATRTNTNESIPLAGEDIDTEHWEDARHWLSIYADLLQFKLRLLERVERELAKLQPLAREAASEDLGIIQRQMDGYQRRLDLWYSRIWDLQGLWIDRESRLLNHRGTQASLTVREHQLLEFLIEHPHRYFSANQILDQAWGDPELFPEEVRNYVQRLRKLLRDLQIPARIVNQPRRGYSLVFNGTH
jgi:DNA-binding response OmpR family regulator